MTYANLDEAFGTPFNRCEEKPVKKEKINCNRDKTKFTVNEKDRKIDTRNINFPESEPTPDDGNLMNNIDFTNFATFSNKPQNNNLLETFENPKQNSNPNEVFEYSEEENNIIMDNVESESESQSKPKPKPKKRKNKKEEVNNSQINEINNKMNFIINQLNNNNNNNKDTLDEQRENNIHDIVLFILFGVFVIVILESLYKLVVKLCKYKMFNQ